jgi:hypothetical protein
MTVQTGRQANDDILRYKLSVLMILFRYPAELG